MPSWKNAEIVQKRPLGPADVHTAISTEAALEILRAAAASPAMLKQLPSEPIGPLRMLTDEEIHALEARLCTAEDWSRVRVGPSFLPSSVRNCRFLGDVALGSYASQVEAAPGIRLPAGLYDSIVVNSVIADDALVLRVGLLGAARVGRGAVVRDCAEVVGLPGCAFGNGRTLALGVETGGRDVASYAELTIPVAECAAKRRDAHDFLAEYEDLAQRYASSVASDVTLIGDGARVAATPCVRGVFLGPCARVENAGAVQNVTLLSSPDEPASVTDGARVRDVILQWGCEASSLALVANSVLTEHSHVERGGMLTDSILGPNSGVAEGEVTACLVGPFVAFHHQALLIAAVWPEGRGNIAYGANVGSNHTSRAPDQEIWPGEGVFYGLGCDIKYPCDLSEAPYSVIASGVTMLPQRLTMPFSLVNPPAINVEAISPSFNEVMPAWVLYANPYALARNEHKYRERNKARRTAFDFSLFRPEIVDAMRAARRELAATGGKQIYTAKDVPGIGKNYLTDRSRRKAIEAYDLHTRHYALRALFERLSTLSPDHRAAALAEASDEPRWEHARRILAETGAVGLHACLAELSDLTGRLADAVAHSREKDDLRGKLTIPGYEAAHEPASEDPVVRRVRGEADALRRAIEALDRELPGSAG